MNRKQFLNRTCIAGLAGIIVPFKSFGSSYNDPKLNPDLVKEFVGKSHSDPGRVKELLEEHPTLLNAAHDWKYGDFETGLGAASHVGNKQLVEFFLQQGAQANIFTMALFGKLDILKPMLQFQPALLHAKGPHGFTLLHHAIKGGEEAMELKEYLESLGATKTKIALY